MCTYIWVEQATSSKFDREIQWVSGFALLNLSSAPSITAVTLDINNAMKIGIHNIDGHLDTIGQTIDNYVRPWEVTWGWRWGRYRYWKQNNVSKRVGTRRNASEHLLHPVLGFPVNPWIHWQLHTWLYGVPKALGPQGSRMQGSAHVRLLASQYFVVWQSGSTLQSGTEKEFQILETQMDIVSWNPKCCSLEKRSVSKKLPSWP